MQSILEYFFPTSTEKLLSSFTSVVTKLEAHINKTALKAEAKRAKAALLQATAAAHDAEAAKASKAAEKIKDLLS